MYLTFAIFLFEYLKMITLKKKYEKFLLIPFDNFLTKYEDVTMQF